jgi:hypothetical protein
MFANAAAGRRVGWPFRRRLPTSDSRQRAIQRRVVM